MNKIWRFLSISAVLFTLIISHGLGVAKGVNVIPAPAQSKVGDGNFVFNRSSVIQVTTPEQKSVADGFVKEFSKKYGYGLKVSDNTDGNIVLVNDTSLPKEAYQLDINPNLIKLKASDRSGYFYGFQTLYQLLTSHKEAGSNETVSVPAVSIQDEPRFEYRGTLLDASRYFIPKEEVIRIIDAMALLKLNKLHFHLTDDNGWRIESKLYPKLTEIGAWSVDRGDTPFPARRNPEPGEPTTIGGFYTQDDLREIVAYASDKAIEVIPEIDMPAHSNAVLAAYPELACPVVDKFIGVLPGLGGDNADIIYCAGNDSVFVFLQNVLDEVMEIFPSKYIHLGGDEAWKTHWDKCPLCQERIVVEGLNNSEDLQGWFMAKMSDYVRSKGREVIGWDELTNSEIPEEAIIMGWQGMGNAALKGAEKGHRFIMTPALLMYFIRYQGPQWFEPLTYFAGGTLKDVYNYEPVKENWKPEYEDLLMGVQASMWNEFTGTPESMEYQLFPRLTALAEVAWSPKGDKSWEDYLQRLDTFLPQLDSMGITYARSMYNIQQKVVPSNDSLKITFECIRPDVEIRYTLDGSTPTSTSEIYKTPLLVDNSVSEINAATFADGKQMGQLLHFPLAWHKGTAKTIVGQKGDEYMLLNGVNGSLKQTDLEWCSWNDCSNVEFTVDLGQSEDLNEISLGFINNYGMAVHKPSEVIISLSDDNVNFSQVGNRIFPEEDIYKEGNFRIDENFPLQGNKARYVKVGFKGPGAAPKSHVRPGKEVKVYIDEVTIK